MKIKIAALLLTVSLSPVTVLGAAFQPLGIEWSYDSSLQDQSVGSEIEKAALQEKYESGDYSWHEFRPKGAALYENSKLIKDKNRTEQKVWDLFFKIAGSKDIKKYIRRYATYQDPQSPVLGFSLEQRFTGGKSKSAGWVLGVNIAGADFSNKKWVRDIAITLVHEYAHLLTLNEKQVDYYRSGGKKACKKRDTYLLDSRRCTDTDSYLNAFVQKFWEKDGWIIERPIYQSNEFVTKYAATEPVEDIAETFEHFILRSKPLGLNTKEQKILFFYDYKELVDLRSKIREQIQGYFY